MKRLYFLSEHYEPRIGGVTSYIRNICSALSDLGHEVHLIVPGENPPKEIQKIDDKRGFKVISLGTGTILSGNILPDTRRFFSDNAHRYLSAEIESRRADLVHVLFGLYLMQYFDITTFQRKGIPVYVTLHNRPPQECGNSWKGDRKDLYIKDWLRRKMIGWINDRRIRKQSFDKYIVPSHLVKELLIGLVDKSKIIVIGHGIKKNDFRSFLCPSIHAMDDQKEINILTVAGFLPHKNQHLIPSVVSKLKKNGLQINWNVVGPNKNTRYVDFIKRQIDENQVGNDVSLHFSVPYSQLISFYQNAHIYVQPSSEEGFCITAMDAAAYGLPIVGTKAGAIPEIIRDTHGVILDNASITDIKDGILNLIEIGKTKRIIEQNRLLHFYNKYNWANSANQLIDTIK